MKQQFHLCCLAYCALAMGNFVAAAEMVPEVPQEGLLVLANGSVIEGSVVLDGEYYAVLLKKGKLQIRVDQVDFFCETMAEAYARRKARRIGQSPTADAHLDVAQWCLQHGLLEFTMAELAQARTIDPQHPLLSIFERRLLQSRALQSTGVATRQAPLAEAGSTIADENVQLTGANEEAQASFGEIPLWARTEFIKRIQPMMVHSCANGGCHSPNSSQEMRIDRNALDGVGNPELIHKNLAIVIAEVDLANPESSRLLRQGATAHGKLGGDQSRPLTPHQLEIVRAWVTQLALGEIPAEKDNEPRVAQIVVGMNSTAQQKFMAEEQTAAKEPDPFDPATFNSESANSATPQVEEQPAESTPPTIFRHDGESPQNPPVQE